jgi:subfamily B ATP-binding cassette protein MsbA
VFIFIPVSGFVISKIGKSLKGKSKRAQDENGYLISVVEETLGGLRIIKAFNAEKKMNSRFNTEINDYRRIMNRLMRRRELAHPLSELLGTIVIIIVVWYGGSLILEQNSELSGPEFIIYLGIFYQIINPAKAFTTALYSIQKGLASMDRIDKILLADVTIKETQNAKQVSTLKNSI